MRSSAKKTTGTFLGQTVTWAYALIILAPILWIVLTSFMRQIDILLGAVTFKPVLSNYRELLFSKQASFLHDLWNSLVVASASTILVLLTATLAAFTLTRLRVPRWWTWALFGWAMLFHMLPTLTFISAWFVLFAKVGLFNTYLGLILAHTTNNLPIGLFLMATFLRDVPEELLESARLDGCSNAGTFFRIALPLVRPGLIAAGALVFIFSWSDFVIALNLVSKSTQTVPVSIATFAQEYEIRYGEMAAGAVLSAIPALLLIVVGQKFIVKGLLAGAVK